MDNQFPSTRPSLVELFQTTDPAKRHEGLDRLAAEFGPRVQCLVRARVFDPHLAEDLVQGVWAVVVEAVVSGSFTYDPAKAGLGAWLATVIRGRINNHFNSAWVKRKGPKSVGPSESVIIEQLAAKVSSHLGEDVRLKFAAAFLIARNQLKNDIAWDAFRLRWLVESRLSRAEVASQLGITPEYVGVLTSRFLQRLRKIVPDLIPEVVPPGWAASPPTADTHPPE